MRALNEWAKRYAQDTPHGYRSPTAPELAFCYHWGTAVQTYEVWQSKGVLPDTGGWLDQDPYLVNHDWAVVSGLVAMWRHELSEVS